ncbi:MAG: hypothetical protein ACLSUI_04800 [Eubacterium sp.]
MKENEIKLPKDPTVADGFKGLYCGGPNIVHNEPPKYYLGKLGKYMKENRKKFEELDDDELKQFEI